MKQLKKGDLAPTFTAKDYRGNRISLKDFYGKKILLSFHAFGSCPFCNLRVRELSKKYKEWGNTEFEMIHVFPSSQDIIGEFAGKDNPDFPIVSDPEKTLFKLYGAGKSIIGMLKGFLKVKKLLRAFKVVGMVSSLKNNDSAMHQLPADFLIDEKGILQEVYYATSTSDNLPISRIKTFLTDSKKEAA